MIWVIGIGCVIVIIIIARISRNKSHSSEHSEFYNEPSYQSRIRKTQEPPKPREDARQEIIATFGRETTKKKQTVICFDLETNGLTPSYSILSCSGIKCFLTKPNYELEEMDRFERYYFPVEPYEEKAIERNGLTKEVLTKHRGDATYPKHYVEDSAFMAFCNECDIFITHNIDFDSKFVPLVKNAKTFCTMKTNTDIVAAKWLAYRSEYKYPTLDEAAEFYKIPIVFEKLHTSMYDAELSLNILREMFNRATENMKRESICPYCSGVLAKYPFKKIICPHCQKDIHVRRTPYERGRKLVTKAGADRIDQMWIEITQTDNS